MNFGFITYIIGWILNFQGLFLLVPCIVSMAYNEKSGAGNPGFPRLVQVTSGGFSWWL